MARPKRKRLRKSLGLTADEHLREARNWERSASQIFKQADAMVQRNPCGAIEHLTDAIAEGTVAEAQFSQAGEKAQATFASDFVSRATRRQREAVQLCRREPLEDN